MANKIAEMIKNNKIIEISELLSEKNEVDIAKCIMKLGNNDQVLVFRMLTKEIAVRVFSYLEQESKENIIESISDTEVRYVIDKLFLDDTVDFMEELPANIVKKVLRNTSSEKRELINQFLKYKEETAGAVMTIEFVDLKENMNVKEAIDYTRRTGINKEMIDTCFVIDEGRRLKGTISLKSLILSRDDDLITNIMESTSIYVKTNEDQENIASLFKEYDLLSMAVVDNEERLVGIITIDDVVDIIEQENTEDFQKMAAMEPNDVPYLKTSVPVLAKNRIVWLLVLMISAMVTGSIIQQFEDVLKSVVILASFIPMLMDTGGNAGSQSSTLVIRGLALGDINLKDYIKVVTKEFKVSLIVAIVLSSVNFLRLYFMQKVDIMIAFTVCGSLFFTVIIAKVVGGILPIIAKKMKLDPAIMASPLITTIVDAFALMVYFSLAKIFLGI